MGSQHTGQLCCADASQAGVSCAAPLLTVDLVGWLWKLSAPYVDWGLRASVLLGL